MTKASTAYGQFAEWLTSLGDLPDKEEHALLVQCAQDMTDRMVAIEMSGTFKEDAVDK